MTIATASITGGTGNTSGAGPYTTASMTFPANSLILCAMGYEGFSAIASTASLSTTGVTWTSNIKQQISSGNNVDAVQWAGAIIGSSAVTQTTSITPPANMSAFYYCFLSVTGTVQTSVAAAINQSVGASARDSGTAADLPPVVFGTFADATNNMSIVAYFATAGVTFTDTNNQTSFYFTGGATTINFGVEYALPPVSSMSYHTTGQFEYTMGAGLELIASGGGGGGATQQMLTLLGVGSVSASPHPRIGRKWRQDKRTRFFLPSYERKVA